jgi:hypothetical protein
VGNSPVDTAGFPISNPAFEPGGANNDENYLLSSGMPMLDIARHVPVDEDDVNEAVVAYVQETNLSPWNSKAHAVWGITSALYQGNFVWFEIAGDDTYPAPNSPPFYTAVLPSVCCHHTTLGQGGPSMEASVSYLRSPAPLYSWQVDAMRVYFDNSVQGNPSVGAPTTIPGSSAWGNFDYSDVNLHCFGASGALAALWHEDPDVQYYWAVWSDTLGVYCEPGLVDGAFGWSEP